MKGDFSRDTFDPLRHFARVLMQQGRPQLDADWNEQGAILLRHLRALAADLIGPHGGPGSGFKIEPAAQGRSGRREFAIREGHYYVDGILCENETPAAYTGQRDYPLSASEKLRPGTWYLVYLDVWERHITSIEDDHIREVALGGSDTATRAEVVWQVKTTDKAPDGKREIPARPAARSWDAWAGTQWPGWTARWQPAMRGQLRARARAPEDPGSSGGCAGQPGARYRGSENRLYRVEIHRGGTAWDKSQRRRETAATFKWSRENGSAVAAIESLEGNRVTVKRVSSGTRFGLTRGDWVEIMDDCIDLRAEVKPLVQVNGIDLARRIVTLDGPTGVELPSYRENDLRHPLLRRWDQRAGERTAGAPELSEGAALLVEGKDTWLALEEGIEVQFEPGATYRTGDYWLIPARTATGDVEWPRSLGDPQVRPPHGVEHHYAPLAIVALDGEGNITVAADLRRRVEPLEKHGVGRHRPAARRP